MEAAMQKKPFTWLAVAVLALVCIAHAVRFAMGLAVNVGSVVIPLWMSGVAAVVTAALAIMVAREARP
jgi:steroid 5-alpha reductase family enzyme